MTGPEGAGSGDFGFFAFELAGIVEFGAADFAFALDFDFFDHGGMDGEHALHAFAVGNAADGEGFGAAVAVAGDHGAGVDLGADVVAFADADVHFDGVADFELGDFSFAVFQIDFIKNIHGVPRCEPG